MANAGRKTASVTVRRASAGRLRLKPIRLGFSLIEALVVLAISGMALAVIFTIGTKAGDTGFGLGRRAMAASDNDIAISDLRSIIRSVALQPPSTFQMQGGTPVSGRGDRLEAQVVMERANQCGPLGWAGPIVLSVVLDRDRSQLLCEAGGRVSVLLDLGGSAGSFSYSRDGRRWTRAYTNLPQDAAQATDLRSETVWIRFASSSVGDVVEVASSGPPEAWVRLNDGL
ncbi:type II secretion system protein [Brevundimonas sp. DC300-4]|uniref:type II secretion system protein n=1 Tax=Brevundimonas sp. DC300-4 TaxID=2804594 RepID=UPI003CFAED86